MDYWYRLGLLGNLSIASGSSYLGIVGLSYSQATDTFFFVPAV